MDIRGLSSKTPGEVATGGAPRPSIPKPRRRWVLRVGLPAIIALATLAMLGYAARDLLLPAAPIEVVRAVAVPDDVAASSADPAGRPAASGRTVAQAPGWVEPDPYPTFASALADGVVREVLVLEGDRVEAGQPLAHLVREDAELALREVQAELARRTAQHEAAKTDLANPVALERGVAVGRAMLAEAKAKLTRLDAEVAAEQARLKELEANYQRLSALGSDSASRLQVEQADYQAQSQRAVVEATRQQRPALEASVQRYEAELHAAERDLALKVQLKRAVDESAAAVADMQARLEQAELRLARMTVYAPVAGIVMNRLVSPGDKVMLGGDDMHSAHAIHLYDPKSLQVRVDVPLGDAAKVGVGQRATIVVDVLPDTEFTGTVTRFVHQADIGKNTVQVKVEIDDPSPLLKPDMLARVKFHATGSGRGDAGEQAGAGTAGSTVAIKQSAVMRHDGMTHVWLVSPEDQRLVHRKVTLGGERDDGWIDILEGLSPGDAVVASPTNELEEGMRVRPREAE